MRLYHGSNISVEHPEIAKGKPFKDFGQGFYLSDTIEQAMEMAQFSNFHTLSKYTKI